MDSHEGFFVGGFTFALVIATILLWRATNNLFKAGERQMELIAANSAQQSRDMLASVAAANESAQAAITANQIAVTNSQEQLRAYVCVKEVSMTTHRNPGRMGMYNNFVEGPVHTYRFAFVLKNGGMTPAINARINVSSDKFNSGVPADFDFPDSTLFGSALIGPQTEWLSPAVIIGAAELENPALPTTRLLWGWIEYDDIFPGTSRHRTEFCFEIRLTRLQPTNDPWLEFVPFARFNAADGDCLREYWPNENEYRQRS